MINLPLWRNRATTAVILASWVLGLASLAMGQTLPAVPIDQLGPRPVESLPVPAPRGALRRLPPPAEPAWWWSQVAGPLRTDGQSIPVKLEDLILEALTHSYYIKAISDSALITQTTITDAAAAFDTRAFVESKFVRRSDPAGNVLETGGPPRLRIEDWQHQFGLQRKTLHGGQLDLSQRIGLYDSNSVFLSPTQQGNSRLSLSYTLPILNGAGVAYNEGLIVLAQLDTNVSRDLVTEKLQQHLLDLVEVYWTLYLERARLVQRRHYLEQAETIARRLRDRRDVDAAKIQVLQADAAVSARRSELLQSEMAINNAQLRIRALVNSRRLPTDGSIELIPGDQPATVLIPVNVTDAMALAVENRAEVDRAMQQVYLASKRLDLATNELLPALDLVLETYVAGLRGDWDIGQAWTDQFEFGEPGYTVGLRLELPLGNRAAKSLHLRRRLELRQVSNSLQSTLETVRSDVSIAVNDVNTTHRQISAKRQAMRAAQAEVDYLYARWQLLPENGRSPSAMLDDLLRAQDRLAVEEQGAAQAEFAYTLALARLKYQLGILLQADAGQPPAGDSE